MNIKENVTVYNLSNNVEYTFLNITPTDALINVYMTENNMTTQLHNPAKRDDLTSRIILGKTTMAIDDYCTSI